MPAMFVHGVTVRQERFDTILRKVTNEMSSVRPGMHVDGFYWGDRATSPTFRGLSIPELPSESDGDVRKKATTPEGVAGEGERWALLLEDPNVELIAIRDRQKFFTGEGLTTPTPENVEERNGILDRNRRQVADALASNALVLAGAGSPLDEKELVALVRSAFAAAKRAHRKYAAADLIEPLSRCLTASLYRHAARAAQALGGGFSWFKVERGVRQVLDDRLGEAKGALARAAKSATLSAFTSASRFGRRRLSDEWLIFCGDICAYLGRRDEILADLDGHVSRLPHDGNPLWLIGHSLGGIICHDYCQGSERKVDRLVTVGSQVGLLGEWGALKSQPTSGQEKLETPASIVDWLNIYDPDDLLSFFAEPIFNRVLDIPVTTGVPFPISHSEYWNLPLVYKILAGQIPS